MEMAWGAGVLMETGLAHWDPDRNVSGHWVPDGNWLRALGSQWELVRGVGIPMEMA